MNCPNPRCRCSGQKMRINVRGLKSILWQCPMCLFVDITSKPAICGECGGSCEYEELYCESCRQKLIDSEVLQ